MSTMRSSALLVALLAIPTPGVAHADEDVKADLIATKAEPNASGYAIFGPVSAEDPENIALEVHVRGISSTDTVDIWIDGTPFFAGIALTDGAFDFFHDHLGFDIADNIEIVDSHSGTLLLSGTFEY